MLRVSSVQSRADLRRFIALPYALYRDDPGWIAPLRSEQAKLFTPRGDPLLAHCDYALFLLWDDNRVVGRVAAFVDHLAIDFWQERAGFWGSYECVDSLEGARLLLDAAEGFLRQQGMAEMRGPINFTVTEWGLVTEGFEYPPVLMSPYNPAYYNTQMEALGMRKAKDLLAFYGDIGEGYAIPERFTRALERVAQRYRVTVRPVEMKHLKRDALIVVDIMNHSVAYNWGAYPVTEEEGRRLAKDLKQIIDPAFALIAEVEGRPIGFCLTLPDLNQLLKGLDGRLTPRLIWRLAFGLKRVRNYRCWALGLLPEYHGKGIDALLYYRTFQAAQARQARVEVNYVLEDNIKMLAPLAKLGVKHIKTYRVYTKAL